MKALARQHLWWPGLNSDIEEVVRKCDSCQPKTHEPTPALFHPWEYPERPWQRVHIDFAGPIYGYLWLIYVDAHSKYPGVIPLTSTNADSTCNALLDVFAHLGFPEQLVSDNGPPFDSAAFAEFCRHNGIRHSRSSPYHPQFNGEAERCVQTFKDAMKAANADHENARQLASKFQLRYRVTPHATIGSAQSKVMFKRSARTRLDLLHPDLNSHVRQKQKLDKQRFDYRDGERHFREGESVFSRSYYDRFC